MAAVRDVDVADGIDGNRSGAGQHACSYGHRCAAGRSILEKVAASARPACHIDVSGKVHRKVIGLAGRDLRTGDVAGGHVIDAVGGTELLDAI